MREKVKEGTKKVCSKLKKLAPIILILAAIVTFLGYTATEFASSSLHKFEHVRIVEAEKQLEQIKISSSEEYVESVLGTPIIKTKYNYYPYSNTNMMPEQDIVKQEGIKIVYNNEFYIIICYFDKDNVLSGYVLTSKNKKFKPIMYGQHSCFEESFYENREKIGGYNTLIIDHQSARADNGTYHIQFYYHHLATSALQIGMGYSALGDSVQKSDNDNSEKWQDAISVFRERYNGIKGNALIDPIEVDNDNRDYYDKESELFSELKPNTLVIFDDYSMNVVDFCEREFKYGLGMNWIDYRLITDTIMDYEGNE